MSKTIHQPDGELHVQWQALENEADPGFTVHVVIGDSAYRQKLDPYPAGAPRDRAIRNVIVSAIEYELSRVMGLAIFD